MPMLYRSPVTRWFLAAVGIIAGAIFAFGDAGKWRNTPSLHWLAQAPIPLQTWGVLFIIYGLLLIPTKTRPIGYLLGAVLFAVFTISILATLRDGRPKNIIPIAGMIDVVGFHLFSIRTALAMGLDK